MLPSLQLLNKARLAAYTLVALVSAWAHPSSAEVLPVVPKAHLVLDASPDCATPSDLMQRVRARTPRVRFVDDERNEDVLAIFARISSREPGVVTGELVVGRSAATSARRVRAGSCQEAAEALALIIAFTLDPTAAERRLQRTDDRTTGGSSERPSSRPSATPPTASPRPPGAPEAGAASAGVDRSEISPGTDGSRIRLRLGTHVVAQGLLGPAPNAMAGFGLYGLAGAERGRVLSPTALLGATHNWQSATSELGGRAAFKLTALSLDACPARVRLELVEVRPCAALLFGRFAARGTDTYNAAPESSRPFWTLGGSLVVTADLGWHLEAFARAALGANLIRDSFVFTPRVFHQVGATSFAASAGIGVRIP